MSAPSKGGSIAPFLEALGNLSVNAAPAAAGTVTVGAPAPVPILNLLPKDEGQSVSVREIFAESGMEITEFAKAIATLRDANLITLRGAGRDQVLELTPTGVTLRSLV